jgi:cytochrome c
LPAFYSRALAKIFLAPAGIFSVPLEFYRMRATTTEDYDMTAGQLFVLLGCTLLSGMAGAAGDAQRGETLYKTMCTTCHSMDYNGVGPAHRGLLERKAGSRPDYTYSAALQATTFSWNDKFLDKWLTNPEKLVPGQKMGFKVASAKDRADLIAYLNKETPQK